MDFLKKFVQLTVVLFLVGFVLGLEHSDSWLRWLGSFAIIAGFAVFVFWEEFSNPRWWRYQFKNLF